MSFYLLAFTLHLIAISSIQTHIFREDKEEANFRDAQLLMIMHLKKNVIDKLFNSKSGFLNMKIHQALNERVKQKLINPLKDLHLKMTRLR